MNTDDVHERLAEMQVNKPANRYQQTGVDILNRLREQRFSYGEAGIALNFAQTLLQKAAEIELSHLPIANGIQAKFNSDFLFLGSERIAEEMEQHPLPYTQWVSKNVWAKCSRPSEKEYISEDCQYRVGKKPGGIYVLVETTYVAWNMDPPFSHMYIWGTLFVFGLSIAAGLLYYMHAAGLMHFNEGNIYRPLIRSISIVQILSFVCGVLMLFLAFVTTTPLF